MPLAPEPDAHVSFVTRLGSVFGAGALAALAASMPAATRVARAADGRFGVTGVWLALAASALVPMIVAVAILRGARRGADSLAGDAPTPRALGAAIWAFAATLTLMAFGAALRATTHHHALAGATYALVGIVVVAALALLTARLVAVASGWPPLAQRAILGALALLLLGALVLVSTRVSRTSPPAALLLVDVLAAFIAAGIAAGPALATSRVFAALGPPLAVIVLVLGLGGLRGAPKVPAAVRTHAPLLNWPVDCTAQLVRKR